MSTNDYIKFLTQQVISYFDKPKHERKEAKQKKKEERPPITFHLFGIIPMAIGMLLKRK